MNCAPRSIRSSATASCCSRKRSTRMTSSRCPDLRKIKVAGSHLLCLIDDILDLFADRRGQDAGSPAALVSLGANFGLWLHDPGARGAIRREGRGADRERDRPARSGRTGRSSAIACACSALPPAPMTTAGWSPCAPATATVGRCGSTSLCGSQRRRHPGDGCPATRSSMATTPARPNMAGSGSRSPWRIRFAQLIDGNISIINSNEITDAPPLGPVQGTQVDASRARWL